MGIELEGRWDGLGLGLWGAGGLGVSEAKPAIVMSATNGPPLQYH